MTRTLLLALLGLAFAGSPALAAKRGATSSSTAPVVRTAAAAKPALAGAGRVAAKPRSAARGGSGRVARASRVRNAAWAGKAAPIRLRYTGMQEHRAASASGATACTRSGGVTRCRVRSVMGGSVAGWAAGLSPAAGIQADECPAGTMATLARGHEDIIRCMPI
jgi:hypothetical protein